MRISLSRYLGLVLVVLTNLTFRSAQEEAVCHSDGTFSCKPDDLSHSILVECDADVCSGQETITESHSIIWPSKPGGIYHVQSSRAGARLVQMELPNLDYVEDDNTRMLDINTTLYIDSREAPNGGPHRQLLGFGATINFFDLDKALRDSNFDNSFGPLFAALFGQNRHGAKFNLMRLLIHPVEDTTIDLFEFLSKLDDKLAEQQYKLDQQLNILVEAHDTLGYRLQFTIGQPVRALANLKIFGLADETGSSFKANLADKLNASLFRSVDIDEIPNLLDDTNSSSLGNTHGLVVRLKPSIPYELLQNARIQLKPHMPIVTVGRSFPKSGSLGDWRNAQDSSIELMNSLFYGSNGHIEDQSIVDVLRDPEFISDASLYSLQDDHSFHLRGPKFYTTAHFSRYLRLGDLQLKTDLFTQPNMFAAHYSAFMSLNKEHIVCVVSNENEHLLPLRLAIDRRIKTLVNIEPKSINTFLINVAK